MLIRGFIATPYRGGGVPSPITANCLPQQQCIHQKFHCPVGQAVQQVIACWDGCPARCPAGFDRVYAPRRATRIIDQAITGVKVFSSPLN
jgi:hypothetical protein